MKVIFSSLVACLFSAGVSAQTAKVGDLTVAEFNKVNEKGNMMVKAIKPSSAPLSSSDQALVKEIAMGGMRQLAMSRRALGSVTREDVRILAQSEVEEQTGIAAKLKEFAAAKGFSLPDSAAPGSAMGHDGAWGNGRGDSASGNNPGFRNGNMNGDTMRTGSGNMNGDSMRTGNGNMNGDSMRMGTGNMNNGSSNGNMSQGNQGGTTIVQNHQGRDSMVMQNRTGNARDNMNSHNRQGSDSMGMRNNSGQGNTMNHAGQGNTMNQSSQGNTMNQSSQGNTMNQSNQGNSMNQGGQGADTMRMQSRTHGGQGNNHNGGNSMGMQGGARSGQDADRLYLSESGVKGHQMLEATMTKVSSQAKDPALKALAAATLPVIRTHLKVSQTMLKQAAGTSKQMQGGSGTSTQN